ncbi:unnamed protein product [Pleuronectes platessa]|uniref:Uncharacterized protein n=1 Tax=Pleuronectes platessa TaxID=8262 RepID=A0A9N7VMY3_PLEPL|nr:unnamed protein product [Pleuronectes platessa]
MAKVSHLSDLASSIIPMPPTAVAALCLHAWQILQTPAAHGHAGIVGEGEEEDAKAQVDKQERQEKRTPGLAGGSSISVERGEQQEGVDL